MAEAHTTQERIKALSARYAIPGTLSFEEGPGGLPVAKLAHKGATATVALLGTTVLSWKPAGREEVFYLSGKSAFAPGKFIRGGIPVCFPWFGPHRSDPALPRHGLFRLFEWDVIKTSVNPDPADGGKAGESVCIEFALADSEATRAFWPYRFSATCRISLSDSLRIEVSMTNKDSTTHPLSCAFHPYFACSDVSAVELEGMAGLAQGERFRFVGEVDRPVADAGPIAIHDTGPGRRLTVTGHGTSSFQIWNPAREKGDAQADMATGDWQRFVCVEPAVIATDGRELQPGAAFTAGMEIYCS
jgi:glucose-6-phosphate 1-epimerase